MKKEIFLFLFTIIIVIFLHFFIYKLHFEYGFSPDDVHLLGTYLRGLPNPWTQIHEIWNQMGPHGTSAVYYIGTLYRLFGFNYFDYQLAILIFKIISVITLYLLIRIVFKNKILTVISTLIYSFHYASTGSMEMVTRSQDYLVIAGMNIFFILYYFIITDKLSGFKWFIFALIIFLISFNLNQIRAYPYFSVVVFIEIFHFLTKRSRTRILNSIKRLIILFAPFVIIIIINPQVIIGFSQEMFAENYRRIVSGNFQLLTTPVATLGSLFIHGDFYRFFGVIRWNDFTPYIEDILTGPTLVFGVLTMFLITFIPKRPLRFFFQVVVLNFLGEIFLFFLINSYLHIPFQLRQSFDPYISGSPALVGIYVLVILYFLFIEWKDNQRNENLLLISWAGILFACVFIWGTWLLQIVPLFGINGYSTIPAMGVSITLGGIFTLAYMRLRKSSKFTKLISPLIFLILIPYFQLSSNQIQKFFDSTLTHGMSAYDQIKIRNEFWRSVGNLDNNTPAIFYLEIVEPITIFDISLTDRFSEWIYLYNPKGYNARNCTALITGNNRKLLDDIAVLKNGQKGFIYNKYECIGYGVDGGIVTDYRFNSLNNFYAFRLNNGNFTDIKSDIVKNINFINQNDQ